MIMANICARIEDADVGADAETSNRSVVTKTILRLGGVVAREEHIQVVVTGKGGAGGIDPARKEAAGDTADGWFGRHCDGAAAAVEDR